MTSNMSEYLGRAMHAVKELGTGGVHPPPTKSVLTIIQTLSVYVLPIPSTRPLTTDSEFLISEKKNPHKNYAILARVAFQS